MNGQSNDHFNFPKNNYTKEIWGKVFPYPGKVVSWQFANNDNTSPNRKEGGKKENEKGRRYHNDRIAIDLRE